MKGVVERLGDPGLRARHLAGESPWIGSAKLKLVDGCNLRCFMCDYWRRRREGELTRAEVAAALADLAALGCRKVHLTGGEVFLRRDLVDVAAEATRLGMRVNLTTNGTLVDKPRAKALLKLPVRSITVSLDAPVRALHDDLRGRHGAWKESVRAIERLLAWRGPRTRVRLNTVVSRRSYRALIEMPALLERLPVDGWLLIPMDPGGDARGLMRAEDVRAYNAQVAPSLAERVRLPGFDPWIYGREADVAHAAAQRYARGRYTERLCHAPWFHLLIGPEGDVYPCCHAHRRVPALGNLREAPLRAIWVGSAFARLRREMLVARMAVCHGCDDFLAENAAIDRALGL